MEARQTTDPATVPWTRSERFAGALLARSGPALAGFVALTGLLAAVLVPLHSWRPVIAVPVLVLLAAAVLPLVRYLPSRPVPTWTTAACVSIAAGHGLWAALTHAEQVVLRRDAGSYALYTEWIATRHGLQIPARLDAFGGVAALADPAFRLASPAFFEVSTGSGTHLGAQIVPQFLLGAPALYSLGWWATGSFAGVFVVPAIVSAAALLAIAGLATRLCGARWAVLVTATLAICQPVLHAARSTYSEPAALLLVAAAVALLVDAVRAGNPDTSSSLRPPDVPSSYRPQLARRSALAAGLAFGLAGLIRVDALREVSLLLPVAAVLALRGHPAARPLTLGALGGTAVAAVPALLLSRPYLGGIAGSLVPLVGAFVVLGIGSLVAVRWGPVLSRGIGRRLPRITRLPQVVTALVLLAGVLLASRPLWLTVRQSAADPGSRVVAGLQLRQGLGVDGGRTYAEHSVNWLNWYLGPGLLLGALLLFAGLAGRSVHWWRSSGAAPGPQPVPVWLGPAVVALGSVLLTLYRPGITPDHPWADRRMVPVVIPALVIAAGGALAWAGRKARRRWSAPVLIGVLVAGAAAMLVPAWLATAPLAGSSGRTERGEPEAVTAVCAALRPGDAVIAVDSRGSNEWPQLIRGVCGYPSASVKASLAQTPAAAAVIARRVLKAGHRPVLLAASPDGLGVLGAMAVTPRQVVDLSTTEDQHLLERRPDGTDPLKVQVWLAPLES